MHGWKSAQKTLGFILLALLLNSCISKQSQLFIFYRRDSSDQAWRYYETDLYDPSKIREIKIIPCNQDPRVQPLWSPDGKYYACSAAYDQPLYIFDTQNRILAEIGQGNPNDPLQWGVLGWSPDSQSVLLFNSGSLATPYEELAVMRYDGTGLTSLAKQTQAMFSGVAWSSNGNWIAYEITSHSSKESSIIILDLSGRQIARFDLSKFTQNSKLFAMDMVWSPDNEELAFNTIYNFDTDSKLYVLNLQSGRLTNPVFEGSLCIFDIFGWSPDSDKLLFDAVNCREHTGGDFFDRVAYSVNADGSNLKPLTSKGNRNLYWTPDGKSILVDGLSEPGIYLIDLDGKILRKITDKGFFVSWIRP